MVTKGKKKQHTHNLPEMVSSFAMFLFFLARPRLSRSDGQQPLSGHAQRRPAHALQPHHLQPPVPGPLVIGPRHQQERLQNSLCW